MTRYIDAERYKKKLLNWVKNCDQEDPEQVHDGQVIEDCAYSIDDEPTVDAVPVVHAHWESYSNPYAMTPGGCPYVRCSRCHGDGSRHLGGPEGYLWKYCPCCGAKMDGDEHDNG